MSKFFLFDLMEGTRGAMLVENEGDSEYSYTLPFKQPSQLRTGSLLTGEGR